MRYQEAVHITYEHESELKKARLKEQRHKEKRLEEKRLSKEAKFGLHEEPKQLRKELRIKEEIFHEEPRLEEEIFHEEPRLEEEIFHEEPRLEEAKLDEKMPSKEAGLKEDKLHEKARLEEEQLKKVSLTRKHLSGSDVNSVEAFLLFIGWPRSCHSIIGSMLDAHPNMIVAHEYFLFKKLRQHKNQALNRSRLYEELYRNSYENAHQKGWRHSGHNEKGYSLSIDGSWQGRFKHLKVIGDKSGGRSVIVYQEHRLQFTELYQQLLATVKVPVKVIQVVRNPLDMIATATLYAGSSFHDRKAKAAVRHKYKNFALLKQLSSTVLGISQSLMSMISDVGLSPLEIHCEDLIADPAKTISNICRFLDVECSADYLQMCVDKTFKNVSESRHLVQWDPQTLPQLTDTLRTFPFFKKYNLTTDKGHLPFYTI